MFIMEASTMVGNYPVVTLCGSTRFKKEFYEVQKRLTLEGNIVISAGRRRCWTTCTSEKSIWRIRFL
jgi:hypothetical protein